MGKYLIKGSILKCDQGEKESKFNPDKKTVTVQGKPVGTTKDCKAGIHIKEFKGCKLVGKCKLETELINQNLKWENYRERTTIEGHNVITEKSICKCPIGGKISVVDTTQIEGNSEKNELLSQIENLINQSIQKVANDMIQLRNDMGMADKNLNIDDKMKIFREFEEINPYYKNFERLYGKSAKNIMKEQVLDEVLYQVRTEEGYTWMSKRDLIFMILIFFMLFGMLEREAIFLVVPFLVAEPITIMVLTGVVVVVSVGAMTAALSSSRGGYSSGTWAPDFSLPKLSLPEISLPKLSLPKISLPNFGSEESTESIETATPSISIGSTGYVRGVDGVGSLGVLESFDIRKLEEFMEVTDTQIAALLEAINTGDKAKAKAIAKSLNERFKKKLDFSFENYIKYSKVNDYQVYVGITGGLYADKNSPFYHIKARDYSHFKKNPDLAAAILDKSTGNTGKLDHRPDSRVWNSKKQVAKEISKKWGINPTVAENISDYMAVRGRELGQSHTKI